MLAGAQVMLASSNGIVPLLLLLLIGALAPMLRIIKSQTYRDLSNLLFRWTFPLTMAYTIGQLTVDVNDVLLILAYTIASILVLPLCVVATRFVDTKDNFIPALAQLWSASTLNNTIVVGLPIASSVYGVANADKFCYLQVISTCVLMPCYYFLWELHKVRHQEKHLVANELIGVVHKTESHAALLSSTLAADHANIASVALADVTEPSTMSAAKDEQGHVEHLDPSVTDQHPSPSDPPSPSSISMKAIIATTLKNTFQIPVVVGTIVAIIYLLFSSFVYHPLRRLPTMIDKTLIMTASLTSPMGALMLGCFISYIIEAKRKSANTDRREMRKSIGNDLLRFAIITIIKQVIVPFIFLGVCYGFNIDAIPVMVSTLSASSCTAIFSFAMSDQYSYHTLSVGLAATLQIILMFAVVPMLYYTGAAVYGDLNI